MDQVRTQGPVMCKDVINCCTVDKESVASSESTPRQQLYRYSTRRELITRYRDAVFQNRNAGEPCDEVMQAACCLVSMKSRTSV